MADIYKVAVGGCGRISGHQCRSIVSVDGMEIIAVCDLIEEKAIGVGTSYFAELYCVENVW